MKYPKLKFKLDENLDKEICPLFITQKIGDENFGQERIIFYHPALSKAQGPEEMNTYIKNFYKQNKKIIRLSLERNRKIWQKVEKEFYHELKKIFGDLAFGPKELTAFISIFNCGVICDDKKSFQIFYQNEPSETRRMIAHEILHLFYYPYLRMKKIPENWDKAEIFNTIIINQPDWQKFIKRKEEGYLKHQKLIPVFKKIWKKAKNFDEYVDLAQNISI